MLNLEELGPRILIAFGDGKFFITQSTAVGIIIAIIIGAVGIWLGSGLQKIPKGKQVVAEIIVEWIYGYAKGSLGKRYRDFAPYIGTVFAFLLVSSATGIFGLNPITGDLNVTATLGVMTFLIIQVSGLRANGLRGRLKEFCEPYPFMLPIKLMDEITLPVTLALRLFGNMFGGILVTEMWMIFMEYLSNLIIHNVPFLRAITVLPLNGYFDMFEPVVQTYIFTMLTMVNLKVAISVSGEEDGESKGKAKKQKKEKSKKEIASNVA